MKLNGRRIGVVGYGNIGKYLVDSITKHPDIDLAFVWNRNISKLQGEIPDDLILRNLEDFASKNPTLIVEVCHPIISEQYGTKFLECCDYFVGSPTVFANVEKEKELRNAATQHGLYVPSGALWGGADIQKMAMVGSLKFLKVTMKKHPSCFKLEGELADINERVSDKPVTLYDGPLRGLCPLAPHNVNSMAAAAMAADNLGFDFTIGSLVSDPSLTDWHIIEVEARGPATDGKKLSIHTIRKNPSSKGAVTGTGTFPAIFASVLLANNHGAGVHLC